VHVDYVVINVEMSCMQKQQNLKTIDKVAIDEDLAEKMSRGQL